MLRRDNSGTQRTLTTTGEEIDDEGGNTIRLNRRGYLFPTASAEEGARLRERALQVSTFGMGPFREHAAPSIEPALHPRTG